MKEKMAHRAYQEQLEAKVRSACGAGANPALSPDDMDPLAYVRNMEQEQCLLRGNASDTDPDNFDTDFDNTEGIATTQHLRG